MKKQGVVIPHEHGGWAMVSVPFLLGMIVGNPQWMHFVLFLAWLSLYLFSYPLLQFIKRRANRAQWVKWGAIYGSLAVVFLVPPLISDPSLLYFGPLLMVLLLINIGFAKRNNERALLNDLCAILVFSIGGAAAYLLGEGSWDKTMVAVVLFSFLHFTGSVFFVKTVFRERENKRWMISSKVYHGLILVVPWIVGYPWMVLSYMYSVARTFVYAGKCLRPWKVGMIEMIGAVQFLLFSAFILNHLSM
jgi:hypothetical protein